MIDLRALFTEVFAANNTELDEVDFKEYESQFNLVVHGMTVSAAICTILVTKGICTQEEFDEAIDVNTTLIRKTILEQMRANLVT